MSCRHCPDHCPGSSTTVDDLRLPARPAPGGRTGVNRSFYVAFAAAYDLARSRSAQPMRLLREANAGLTPTQCSDYLKRARALGYVRTPARDGRPPAPRVTRSAEPSPAPMPMPAEVDDLTDEEIVARSRAAWATITAPPNGYDPATMG